MLHYSQKSLPIFFKGEPVDVEENDPSQPNRFSAVIEKIERLYMVFFFLTRIFTLCSSSAA